MGYQSYDEDSQLMILDAVRFLRINLEKIS